MNIQNLTPAHPPLVQSENAEEAATTTSTSTKSLARARSLPSHFENFPAPQRRTLDGNQISRIQLQPRVLVSPVSKTSDITADAIRHIANKNRELHAIEHGDSHPALESLVTKTNQAGQARLIRDLVDSMLISPAAGEVPKFNDEAWGVICDFDARRRNNDNCATMPGNGTFQRVSDIAANPAHPRHADAKLLKDIMTRPLSENSPSLESYLSELVSAQLRETISENFNTTPEYDFTKREDIITFVRTFNGIMQGMALNSQDYTATGRMLILMGATHLLKLPESPLARLSEMKDASSIDSLRAARLQKATFCFPTTPAEGGRMLGLIDFNPDFNPNTGEMDPDPLEKRFGMQFYLDPDSYRIIGEGKIHHSDE